MNIRIITHHAVLNHGAVLQLYALKKVLEKYDKKVCALNYTKNFDFLEDYANNKYNISIKSLPYYAKYFIKKGAGRTFFNIKKKIMLDKFKKKACLDGEYYSRIDKLDAVFIGSDEVFSIEPGLNPFFWGMGVPTENVFAYAACFGPTTIDIIANRYATEFIRAGIERFKSISVRDNNSQGIIRQLSNVETVQVCDPVILYGYIEESKSFKRPIKARYLLVYAYDERMNSEDEVDKIKRFAKEQGVITISVGFYHKWCDKKINANPIDLLQWIKYAEYVVTDTFHGTVMSLIMNVRFATKIRGNRNKLAFLLEEYGVVDREIKDFNDLNNIFARTIDYNEINKTIKLKRECGMKYIDNCIKSIKNR